MAVDRASTGRAGLLGLMLFAGLVRTSLAAPELALPPRIHIARGLWWELLRVHEAAALAGGARHEASFDVYGSPTGYHGCGRPLGDFPRTAEALARCRLIVIAGCRAGAIPKAAQEQLKRWVEAGGGLLVTGGPLSLGCGGYRGSLLEQLLPASVADGRDFQRVTGSGVLTPTTAGERMLGDRVAVAWEQAPRVFYVHAGLTPRTSADVLIRSDEAPLLISHTVGRGRVALFAGTVCGMAQGDELPFWDWDGWPMALSGLFRWLLEPSASRPLPAGPRAGDVDVVGYEKKRQELKVLTEPDFESVLDELSSDAATGRSGASFDRIAELARDCRDREYALDVLRALVESGTGFTARQAHEVYERIRPYVEGSDFRAPALELARDTGEGRVAMGLRVLGGVGAGEGKALVTRYLAGGLDALPREKASGLPPSIRPPDREDEYLRLAAVRSAMDFADPALAVDFRSGLEAWQAHRSKNPAMADLNADLEQEALAALCRMADARAAAAVLETVVRNTEELQDAWDFIEHPLRNPTEAILRERAGRVRAIPLLRARNRRLEDALARFPANGLPALALEASGWNGRAAEEALQCCLAARPGAEEAGEPVREALARIVRDCSLPSVRLLCCARLRSSPGRLAELLVEMAGGDADDAGFAVAGMAMLPPGRRLAVLQAALRHASPEVRRRATEALVLLEPGARRDLANP